MLRAILFTIFAFSLLLPLRANAQVDQRCFTERQCKNVGGTFVTDNRETTGACGVTNQTGEKLGFCLPVGQADTRVKIGGKSRFVNLGDYIQTVYKYGVTVAGILAVVIIIIAGFQWAMSGGNSEAIGSAQKRIGAAVFGLVLALLSYAILNQINPYLVNLRLPQVFMINQLSLAPAYCDDKLLDTKGLEKIFPKGKKLNESDKKQLLSQASFATKNTATECGFDYLVQNSGGQTCLSVTCPSTGQVCVDEDQDGKRDCQPATLAGQIKGIDAIFSTQFNNAVADNDMRLMVLCKGEEPKEVASIEADDISVTNNVQVYKFKPISESTLANACADKPLIGFYIGAEINDELSLSLPAVDDWHAIGKSSDHKCDVNLSKLAYHIFSGGETADCVKNACSCGYIDDLNVVNAIEANGDFKKHLLTLKELLTGYTCDVTVTRAEFPSYNQLDQIWGEDWRDHVVGLLAPFFNAISDETSCT